MFPGGIEYIVRERQEYFLQEAERMRLIKSLQQQKGDEPSRFWDIAQFWDIAHGCKTQKMVNFII